ncbi:cathepsin B precursor [Aphelenchoides avenae]|nr:cathepsin B precursor [Aphelenchus avenae]
MVAADEPAATGEISVPANFDIRDRWPECLAVFNRIRNQPCNNCWAFSSTSAMSDRICVASGAKTRVLLSADDLTTCCASCQAIAHKCAKGGYPEHAFKHWIKEGIVTEICKPTHKFGRNTSQECVQQCKNPRKSYAKSKHYGRGMLRLSNATRIQQEIFANGSVEAMFFLHKDLYKYKEGIYIPVLNATNKSGYHSVRLIGWGELNVSNHSLPYWIGVNSWGRGWGENGTFRIIRGINAANVERYVIAGYPLL